MALSEFQKAFKAARSSGETEFEFEGKKYNTKYKEEAESSAKPSKPSQDASKNMGSAVGSQSKQPPKKEGGIGPYNVGAGPSEEEKQATYSKYAENRKKMGDSSDDSGSKPIAESDWAKSVRSSQSGDTGFLGKKMREALGSSYKKGGSVSSASSRADGCAKRGKTRGRIV